MNKQRMLVVTFTGIATAATVGVGSEALGLPDVVAYILAAAIIGLLIAFGLPFVLLDDRTRHGGGRLRWSSDAVASRSTRAQERSDSEVDGVDVFFPGPGGNWTPRRNGAGTSEELGASPSR